MSTIKLINPYFGRGWRTLINLHPTNFLYRDIQHLEGSRSDSPISSDQPWVIAIIDGNGTEYINYCTEQDYNDYVKYFRSLGWQDDSEPRLELA